MSTATIPEVKDELLDKVNAFVMPKAMPGQTVNWYRHGTAAEKVEIAVVMAGGNFRGLALKTLGTGQLRQPVRHVSDPKLQLSADQREHGAWDFTDHDKQQQARLARLETELAELKRLVTEPATPKGNKDKS